MFTHLGCLGTKMNITLLKFLSSMHLLLSLNYRELMGLLQMKQIYGLNEGRCRCERGYNIPNRFLFSLCYVNSIHKYWIPCDTYGYRARDTTQFLPSRNSHSTLLDSYSDVALAHSMQFIPVLDSANLKNIFPFN